MGLVPGGGATIWGRWGLVATILVFAAIYARTLAFEFVWDDVQAIRDNPIYAGPLLDGLAATQHDHLDPALRQLSGTKPAHDSYRPLLYLSFRSDAALFGMSPRGMHLHNLILGILAIVAFYYVASIWLRPGPPALIATAIFALHPLQVESVAYISGRSDILAGLFGLLAVASALRFEQAHDRRGRGLWLFASTACLLASLLSKEAYIGLPIALAGIALSRGRLRAQRTVLLVWVATIVPYLVLRLSVGDAAGAGTGAPALAALPGVFLRYLQIAVLPFDLSTERLYDAGYSRPGWVALGAFAAWVTIGVRRGWSETARTVASGLMWMLVLLGPSVVVIIVMGVVADRYSYLPLAGFAISVSALLTAACREGNRLRPVLGVAGILWAVMCIAVTVVQVGMWKDNRTLYGHAVVTVPQSSMAHYRLGYSYAEEGEWPKAIVLFERAVALQPSNLLALNNLGVAYLNLRKYEEAAGAFERALAESGQMHFRSWYNLGVVQMRMGERESACASVERALRINPSYSAAASFHRANCERRE